MPGWSYFHSAVLGMRYAVRSTASGSEVMTEDKIHYSPEEVRLISEVGEITPQLHAAKKIFRGHIVGVEKVKKIKNNEKNP